MIFYVAMHDCNISCADVQARRLTSGLGTETCCWRKPILLRELIGCDLSWQRATRLQGNESRLAVL